MPRNYEVIKDYHSSWYATSANRLVMTLGALKDEVNCDVCVIGGGFTGLSAALELIDKGFSVTLLEANSLAGGASGMNGGHLQRGFSKSPGWMIDKFGLDQARLMSNLTLEGLALIIDRIRTHDIRCDLKFGHVTAGLHDKHLQELQTDINDWQKLGHSDIRLLNKREINNYVSAQGYIGGLYDPKAGHFHPLNYALGLAEACRKKGVRIHDNTKVTGILNADTATPVVTTEKSRVSAKYVLVAGAMDIPGFKTLRNRSITATAHMIATEPLTPEKAQALMPGDAAVIDANFIMNYYRLSADRRMLFGGNCNYSGRDFQNEDAELQARMLAIFPSMKNVKISHCWHGPLDLTANRMPYLGRLTPQVYFARGFGGHGVIATNILGKVMAEAIGGTATRFDMFDRIRHTPLLGGDMLKRPIFMLGMLWYRLRDLL